MKSILVVMAALMMAGCGGCPIPGGGGSCGEGPPEATLGGCCDRSGQCDVGLVCLEGRCSPCGDEGVQCCRLPAVGAMGVEPTCNGALTCVPPPTMSGPELCQRCGNEGEACCDGVGAPECGPSMACLSHVCVAGAAACAVPSGAATQPFSVGIIDANQCALRILTITSDTFEHAKECAGTMLTEGELVRANDLGALTVIPTWDYCVSIRGGERVDATPPAFTSSEADVCACGDNGVIGCIRMPRHCDGT
jgi:hypothetical protein